MCTFFNNELHYVQIQLTILICNDPETMTALYNAGLVTYEDDDSIDIDYIIKKINEGEYDEILDEFDMSDILPSPCPNRMECEEKLRADLFSTYSPILKPTEMEFMDVTFVELNLVLDKVLEVSQTGEFMSVTGIK